MKDIQDIRLPEDCRFAESHEWARKDGDQIKVGISDYAQDQLGDIVFVELPEVGESLAKGAEFGTVESVKAVSEIYMPVAGEVVAVNEALAESPELVNGSPYDDGWMIAVKPDDAAEIDGLMDADAYRKQLEG
jgi:glycine cleavage system H protein